MWFSHLHKPHSPIPLVEHELLLWIWLWILICAYLSVKRFPFALYQLIHLLEILWRSVFKQKVNEGEEQLFQSRPGFLLHVVITQPKLAQLNSIDCMSTK